MPGLVRLGGLPKRASLHGFSHAVVATGTRSIRIAGQIGREPGQAHIPTDADAGTQWRIALSNLVTAREAAGGQPEHLVALLARMTDIAEFNAGRDFPAMTLVQAFLP